eukprot:GHRQ01033598.1.p1 GENE.GHRQ01033598.1~~GHRQ01033598.1.p1  ORF type:complete len:173 (+),score=58.59 GHRQ01033598.1:276-794(+)
MYKSILLPTQRSFAAMKRRLGSKTATGIFYMERPFFDVDVELKLPNITLNPTLDDIQDAINSTAKTILQASRQLRCWGMINGPPTYYDLIARDKEVVKSVLLLTGSIEGVKQQVAEYLSHFDKYAFLWKQSLQVGPCQRAAVPSGVVCLLVHGHMSERAVSSSLCYTLHQPC